MRLVDVKETVEVLAVASFNSRLVRLVVIAVFSKPVNFSCFNSRLVRLVANPNLTSHSSVKFQFQIGAIGSFPSDNSEYPHDPFQFQIGAIGRMSCGCGVAGPLPFQFQIGAIGSLSW